MQKFQAEASDQMTSSSEQDQRACSWSSGADLQRSHMGFSNNSLMNQILFC